jgi:hypothetical protein
MSDEEVEALHCLGMCDDWAGHPAYEGEDHAGLRDFLSRCGAALRWQRDEIDRLRADVFDEFRAALIAGASAHD